MARRAQSQRPHHDRAARTRDRRHRPVERLARGQFGADRPRSQQRLCHRAGGPEPRWVADHRPGHGAHPQCGRQEFAADDHPLQSDPLSARHPRYHPGDPDHPCVRDHRRQDRRERRGRARRLGLRQMQRRKSVPRNPRPDPDLPEERFRSQAPLSGGVHRPGPAGARHRFCRLPRRRLLLPQCHAGRRRHAQPARQRRVVDHHPGAFPVGQFHQRLLASRLQSGRSRTTGLATARGRSSPATLR